MYFLLRIHGASGGLLLHLRKADETDHDTVPLWGYADAVLSGIFFRPGTA